MTSVRHAPGTYAADYARWGAMSREPGSSYG
jgi:hypothetical protein